MTVCLRIATPADAAAAAAIYAPYVRETAITFEIDAPDATEFGRRIEHTLERYPYIVAQDPDSGRVMGYAYAGAFKGRAAYDWAVETSLYVDRDARGQHLGSRLHEGLLRCCELQGVVNLEACIAYPDEGGSVGFHERMGYRMVGRFERCGYKLGRWWDMVWMERFISEHPACPAPLKPFPAVRAEAAALLAGL